MENGLSKIKRSRTSQIQRLVEKSLDHSLDSREVNYDKMKKRERIEFSLQYSDDSECHKISDKIRDCKKYNQQNYKWVKKGYIEEEHHRQKSSIPKLNNKYINSKEVCQSLWCSNCRHYLYQNYKQRILKRLDERLIPIPYSNFDFHHLSGVIGLCDLDENKLLKMIKEDNLKWRRIKYRLNRDIKPKDTPFIEVVYEFELVDWRFLRNSNGSDFKKKQIQQLLEHQRHSKNSLTDRNKFLFVHFHSITNLSKSQIDMVFENEYFVGDKPLLKMNKRNGLYVQKFSNKNTLEKNIDKLTSYPFKDPHRYKHSFRGSDYLNGEYYDYEDLSQLIKIYQKVQKRNWRGLFRTIEHLTSVDMLKYKKLFPKTHSIYQSNRIEFGSYRNQHNPITHIPFEHTMLVDSDGNVYDEGYNPNNFFPNGLTQTIEVCNEVNWSDEEINRIVYLRTYKGDVSKLKKLHSFTKKNVDIKLEEFFYPKMRKFRRGKKDKIFWEEFLYQNPTMYGIKLKKDIDSMSKENWKRYCRRTDIKDLHKLPLNIDVNLDDENLWSRLETVNRLNKTERQMYFRNKLKSDKTNRTKWIKEYLDLNK